MISLHVNVDHVATVRQARRASEPDPVTVAGLAEVAGANGITVHLREDRRHIQDRDVRVLRETVQTVLNLEMAKTAEMLKFAIEIQPEVVTLVPEKREEVTTEGGLDIAGNINRMTWACEKLGEAGIEVSLFIDPEESQIDAAVKVGAPVVELHTGQYADAKNRMDRVEELERIRQAAAYAHGAGLQVNAGHGLHLYNVEEICKIPQIVELNIGHSIIAQAVISGLSQAVRDMKQLILGL